MKYFWELLPRPFTVLAPMDDVTDVVFRQIVAQTARPDIFFTEFTSSEALFSPGRDRILPKLQLTSDQHPVVAQLWGVNPEAFKKAGELVRKLCFDGIDINMGCPDHNVMKKGSGAKHITDPENAGKIIAALKDGAGDLPVSVKTRIGVKDVVTEEWTGFLLKQGIAALIVHGRTARQMSRGFADWEEIGKVVKIRDRVSPETVIIGNGDVKSYQEVKQKREKYGVDGVMIGKGIFSDPWVFDKSGPHEHKKEEYLNLCIKHLNLYEETYGKSGHFEMLKKFFKMYVREFDGANELRIALMETNNIAEAETIINRELTG